MNQETKAKAYKEAFVILSYVPKEDLNKIPKHVLEKISNNMDKNYFYEVVPGKNFDDAEMLPETKALLALLFKNYWATDEQRTLIEKRKNIDNELEEIEKRKKYNPNYIFKNNSNMKNEFSKNSKFDNNNIETSLLEIKETFFQKIINYFKSFFKLN